MLCNLFGWFYVCSVSMNAPGRLESTREAYEFLSYSERKKLSTDVMRDDDIGKLRLSELERASHRAELICGLVLWRSLDVAV